MPAKGPPRPAAACSLGKLGALGAHLIDIAAKEVGDIFDGLACSQAVPQVLEIEFRPGLAAIDVEGAGRWLLRRYDM